MMEEKLLIRSWSEEGQEHLFAHWAERPEAQRRRLLRDLAGLDRLRLRDLIAALRPSASVTRAQLEPIQPIAWEQWHESSAAREAGEELIAGGRTGVLAVAGGQGSRLGWEGPKGCFPISPIRRASLFQIFAEKILAARRRYGVSLPWYIMTSPLNHRRIRAFFVRNSFFGLDPGNVVFFPQRLLPTLTPEGRLLLSAEGGLFQNPDGHGGTIGALRERGLLRQMAERGIEELFYFQVDNPLVRLPDPQFLGRHRLDASEMSSKVIPKAYPEEKLGVIARADGRPGVTEYSDLDASSMRSTIADGRLRFSHGSIAVHLLNVAFLSRTDLSLPLHLARKKVSILTPAAGGGRIEEREAVKFETFIFDAIPFARRPLFLETRREEEFAPLKNATGADSIETCTQGMIRLYASWLERCGVEVPRIGDRPAHRIEISPLYAPDAEALKIRLGDTVNRIDADTLLH